MLREAYEQARLLDNYDVYDCLLNYWNAKLQDDVYAIKAGGYEVAREIDQCSFQFCLTKGSVLVSDIKLTQFRHFSNKSLDGKTVGGCMR